MNNNTVIPKPPNSIAVVDTKTGMHRYTLHVGGEVLGYLVNENIANVQIRDMNGCVKNKVINLETGMLQYTI